MRFAREAWPFVLPFWILAAALAAFAHPIWAIAAFAVGFLVLLFFRDPAARYAGNDAETILAPAFGLVTTVDQIEEPGIGPGRYQRVVTFLSVFDVHLQRAPLAGEVVSSTYRPGKYVAAWHAEADRLNAGHLSVLRRPNGDLVGVRQVVGLVARRIVCYLREGQRLERGETIGLIKFGSRVDLLLPVDGYEVLVRKGDRVRGGITPMARARS
jgi:phosphatidylserine decarboxylase